MDSQSISTHSLTKRLTKGRRKERKNIIFQLTASRRGWRRTQNVNQKSGYFNSQPHEEADPVQSCRNIIFSISTHSLTKRLTAAHTSVNCCPSYFNSQPHEEADSTEWNGLTMWKVFQLTASRRGWQFDGAFWLDFLLFQLTASRRGWLLHLESWFLRKHFNSQPHEEADL